MDCAAKLERHVQALPGVKEAKLNFAASKLTVLGTISTEELQREVKKIEDVTLHPVGTPEPTATKSFWASNRKALTTGLSLLALATAFIVPEPFGKGFLLASIAVGGHSLLRKGTRNLIRLNFDMNVLMTVAITGALLIGEWKEAAVVTFLFAVSEMLESYSMEKARQSIRALMEIAPKVATVLRDGQEIVVPVEDLVVGDIILVKPGEKIAADGEIVEGTSSINEAAITGESMPVDKTVGDSVYAGTLNQQGAIKVRVQNWLRTRRSPRSFISWKKRKTSVLPHKRLLTGLPNITHQSLWFSRSALPLFRPYSLARIGVTGFTRGSRS